MSFFPRSRARGYQKLPCLKYYYVLKWENRFTLEFYAAKNTDYMEKCFKAHLHERPSHSDSSCQRLSHLFEHESCEVASRRQNQSDQWLCLNRFKLCNWFASRKIIAARKSLIWAVFFGVFRNSKLSWTGFVLIFFSASDVIIWTSSRWLLVTGDYTTTNSLRLGHSCKWGLE